MGAQWIQDYRKLITKQFYYKSSPLPVCQCFIARPTQVCAERNNELPAQKAGSSAFGKNYSEHFSKEPLTPT